MALSTTGERNRARWMLPLGLMLVVLVTRAVFVYGGGMPEADSVVMAAGMAKGMQPGVGLGDATLYGRQLSPGAYAFVDAVYPLFFDTPRHIIAFLNWLAVVAAALVVLPMVSVLRTHLPDHAVAGTVLIAAFSPVVWEWGTYFHPLVPAVLLLFLALECARRGGVAWTVVAMFCAAAAMVIRAEVLFVVPAIVVWAIVSPGRRGHHVVVAFALVAAAFACYLIVVRSLPRPEQTQMHNLRSYVSMIYHMYISTFSLPGLTRSLGWMGLSVGLASIAAAGVGTLGYLVSLRSAEARRWDRGHALVASAFLWVLPSLLFWLPQPAPITRHYVLSAIGIAWLIGYLILRNQTPRRAAVVTAVVIILNLMIPEAAYRVYNARHPAAEKYPHGAFFYQQMKSRDRIERHGNMAATFVDEAEATGAAALVGWDGYAYILYELYARGHRAERIYFERENPNVALERFRVGEHEAFVVQGIRLNPGQTPAQYAHRYLATAVGRGMTVYAPREGSEAGFTADGLGGDVVTY